MIDMFVRYLLLENKLRPNVHENWGVGTGPWGGQDPKKYGTFFLLLSPFSLSMSSIPILPLLVSADALLRIWSWNPTLWS